MEPLFADLGTLSAHREEDEDFGAFLEENPEFFVDFGDDPFEDVPSTSVEEHEHNNSASFVFDTKVHQDECPPRVDPVDDAAAQFSDVHDTKAHAEPSVTSVPQIVSIADPPEPSNRSDDVSPEPPAPEDLLLCKAIDFDVVASDVQKSVESVVVVDDNNLVVKPNSIVLVQNMKSEPINLESENKLAVIDSAVVGAAPNANGTTSGEPDEGDLAPQESASEPPPIKKLKPKPSPLCITQTQLSGTAAALNSPTPYQSLLRSPLLATAPYSPPPYTPPPMLSPCRKATGLFSSIDHLNKSEL